ncbi:MAG TPA: hypothetical protein PKA55_08520 [Rhodoblastus sp.]|nr:hypothetical protein [Rhodoblastus sp.]
MQSAERVHTNLWSRLPAHSLWGALAVGAIALVMSHPAVMSLAGLDIAAQRPGARMIDRVPTGSIAPVAAAPEKAHATIRGVVGLRAAIREHR